MSGQFLSASIAQWNSSSGVDALFCVIQDANHKCLLSNWNVACFIKE